MRRHSDRHHGDRTGAGRRARDRILTGQTPVQGVLARRRELENLILFLGDDLRESALALGGIEAFLVSAHKTLERPDLSPESLSALVSEDIDGRIELLADALQSLRRSMRLIQETISSEPCYRGENA